MLRRQGQETLGEKIGELAFVPDGAFFNDQYNEDDAYNVQPVYTSTDGYGNGSYAGETKLSRHIENIFTAKWDKISTNPEAVINIVKEALIKSGQSAVAFRVNQKKTHIIYQE